MVKIKLWKRIILSYNTACWIRSICNPHISMCTIHHNTWHYQGHSTNHDK
jgi:hypothetical protein